LLGYLHKNPLYGTEPDPDSAEADERRSNIDSDAADVESDDNADDGTQGKKKRPRRKHKKNKYNDVDWESWYNDLVHAPQRHAED
jgi:hypothetical protein